MSESKLLLPEWRKLLGDKDVSVHEPMVPDLIKESAFFPKSLGMRQVPELLVIELFREICFDPVRPAHDNKARELKPTPELSEEEIALLYIARGRSKRVRKVQRPKPYFGPLFPALARNAWPRKQAERVIASQLIDRPLAQYVATNAVDVLECATDIVSALYGPSREKDGIRDVFAETLSKISFDAREVGLADQHAAIAGLVSRLQGAKGEILSISGGDDLAITIGHDFHNLCKMAGKMPRIMWIDLLKSFLRLALPSWLLAHMRLTVLLRDWSLEALGGSVRDHQDLMEKIRNRWRGLLHPTQTGSNEVTRHIEAYMKARVEFSLSAYLVRYALGADSIDGVLTTTKNGAGRVPVDEWLLRCRKAGDRFGLKGGVAQIRADLIPYAQEWGAWLNPQENGQGKNIEEFLRILLRLSKSDDDDGYMLTSAASGGFEKAILFPGPAMLRTALILTAARKAKLRNRGRLVLSDLEHFFSSYGVDFASSAGARPQLISELSRLGFLRGSPDAGDSAELIPPNFGE